MGRGKAEAKRRKSEGIGVGVFTLYFVHHDDVIYVLSFNTTTKNLLTKKSYTKFQTQLLLSF